ncbi:hypothetical protein B0H13DRAFT_1883602 [Mycena leptocephala]|nr:hypothetical protein B0H13DRAFT_1883602 [Mycena leptocephala]
MKSEMGLTYGSCRAESGKKKNAYFSIECFNSWIFSISNPGTLASNALEHFKKVDNPDLKCNLYNALASYYRVQGDTSSAAKFCVAVISLAQLGTPNGIHKDCKVLHGLNGTLVLTLQLKEAQALDIEATAAIHWGTTQKLFGALKDDVWRNCDRARKISDTLGNVELGAICDLILADLYLREGNPLAAQSIYERHLKMTLEYSQVQTYCLERLGDASCWGGLHGMLNWTTVFLVHSLKRKDKVGIYKALLSFGDIFLAQHDVTSLFTVALEGFTQMDIHRSRAECMLRLGDISMGHGDPVEFWEVARPLIANISEDLLEQHRNNLTCLAELHVLHGAGTAEELEDDLSEIEGLDKVDIGDEKELGSIVA